MSDLVSTFSKRNELTTPPHSLGDRRRCSRSGGEREGHHSREEHDGGDDVQVDFVFDCRGLKQVVLRVLPEKVVDVSTMCRSMDDV